VRVRDGAPARRTGAAYVEFLRASLLNMGIYALAAGATDEGEKVHPTEDEIYYVLGGRAMLRSPFGALDRRPLLPC
jgi:hypothetical protein